MANWWYPRNCKVGLTFLKINVIQHINTLEEKSYDLLNKCIQIFDKGPHPFLLKLSKLGIKRELPQAN